MGTIRDVLKDFKVDGHILDCNIDNVNLYKKSQKIEMELSSDNKITLEEIYRLEEFLKKKFQIGTVNMKIKYNSEGKLEFSEELLKNDWGRITRLSFF